MILESLKAGIGSIWKYKRVIVVFYLLNLILGSMIIIPLAGIIGGFVDNSLMRESLGAGMNYDFLFEFLHQNPFALPASTKMFFLVPLVYILAILFLSGGAISIFSRGERYEARDFWGDSGRYFGRIIRLALMSVPVLLILFSLRYLAVLAERIIFGSDPYENVAYWFGVAKIALGILGIIIYGLVLDYARIFMIVNDERRARVALWEAVKFSIGRFRMVFVLALALFLIGIASVALYYFLSSLFSSSATAIIILLIVIQQIYIVFREILRLAYYSSQLSLYRRLSA